MKIVRGDRVRLTDAMADVMNRGLSPRPRRTKVDWHARIGTAQNVPRYGAANITVKWDSAGTDTFPIGALQHADGPVL